jgi:hypothetical protein
MYSCEQPPDSRGESIAALGVITEHVETGARGREQYDIARRGTMRGLIDRFLERRAPHDLAATLERVRQLRGVATDQ